MANQVEKIQDICNKASDAAVQKGDAQAKAWLRRQFASHQSEMYNPSPFGARQEGFDFELDGIWYTLSVRYGYKNQEQWGMHRNFKKSPTNASDEAKAAEGQAKLAALFGK